MRQQNFSSGYGNKKRKGYLFTFDAMIAITIAMAMLIITSYYATTIGQERISQLQTVRTGGDVLAVLHHRGILASLDENLIGNEMTAILPSNYGMEINMTSTTDSYKANTNDTAQDDIFIGAGERFFITDSGKLYHGKFRIWLK